MKTIVIGLGNPILGDDAVGWKVAEQVEQQLQRRPAGNYHEVDIICLSVGGLRLAEYLMGYDHAVIVDAISSGKAVPGTVLVQRLEDILDVSAGHTTSMHDTSLQNAMRLVQQMGSHLPDQVEVVTIETAAILDFSEALTSSVADALSQAVNIVLHLLT